MHNLARVLIFLLFIVSGFACNRSEKVNTQDLLPSGVIDSLEYKAHLDSVGKLKSAGIRKYYEGNFVEAIRLQEKATIYVDSMLPSEKIILADLHNNTGVFYLELGDFDRAMEFFDKAFTLYNASPEKYAVQIGGLYLNMGIISKERTDYQKALHFYTAALTIYQTHPEESKKDLSSAYYNLGAVHQRLKNQETAYDFYQKCLDNSYMHHPRLIAKIIGNLALYHAEKGELELASRYFTEAIDEAKTRLGENHPELASHYNNFGFFLSQKTKDHARAMRYFEKAESIYSSLYGKKYPGRARCLMNMSRLCLDTGNGDRALEYADQSIAAIALDFERQNRDEFPPDSLVVSAMDYHRMLRNLALVYSTLSTGRRDIEEKITLLRLSLECQEKSIRQLDRIRIGFQNEESKLFLSENEHFSYLQIIHTAHLLHEITGNSTYANMAFDYADQCKSASLQSSLRNRLAMKSGGLPPGIQEQEHQYQRDINVYNVFIHREKLKPAPNLEKIRAWENQLNMANAGMEQLTKQIEEHFPLYFHMKYENTAIRREDISRKLETGEVLLHYTLSDSFVYCHAVKGNRLETRRIVLDTAYFHHLANLREHIANMDLAMDQESLDAFTRSAHALYLMLVSPFEHLVDPGKKITIVPDAGLVMIPFEVLLNSSPPIENLGYKNLPYLFRSNPVRYLYAARSVLYPKGVKNKKTKHLLSFAPEYSRVNHNQTHEDINLIANQIQRSGLWELKGTSEEVKAISTLVKSKVYMGKEATEDKFKALAKNYKILHLAMHALIDDENPMYSRLVFSPNPKSNEDGYLETWEIYNMNLDADLAVLSACNTGMGKNMRGEGMISLARGFFQAGVPGVLMTLWSVNDRTSGLLMKLFYENLAKGKDRTTSINEAKIKYLETSDDLKAHPYFWAGYVLIGDSSPVDIKKPSRMNFLVVTCLILLIVVLLVYIIKNSHGKQGVF